MANPFDQFDQKAAPNPFDQFDAKGRGLGESTARGFGLTAQGINDSIATLIGIPGELAKAGIPILPTDIVVAGAKKLGVNLPIGSPTGADVQKGMDFISTLPRRAVDAVSGAPEPQGGYSSRVTPENTMERIVYGAGRSMGDVGAQFAGAGLVSAAAPALTSVAGNVARSMMTAPGTQLAANAVGGGVSEATQNPLYGLAAALGTGGLIEAGKPLARAAMAPDISRLSARDKQLVEALSAEGIPLRTGQITGSKPVKTAEAVLEHLPFSGKMAQADMEAQRQAFNAAALRRTGLQSPVATEDVLAAHKSTLGKNYRDVFKGRDITLGDDFTETMIGVMDKYAGKIDATKKGIVESYVNDLTSPKLGGKIAGDIYQETRSALGKTAKGYMNSDYPTANALMDIRSALDAAAAQSLPAADAAKLALTNKQYANLKTIMEAMKSPAAGSGNIPPKALRQSVVRAMGSNYSTGAGDLNELARAGAKIIGDEVPNSGTTQRMFWQTALTGGPALAGASPATLAGTLVIPPAAEKLIQSEAFKRYLTKPRGTNQTDIQGLLAAALAERMRDKNTSASIKGLPMVEVTK